MRFEVEIKFPLAQPETVRRKLIELGARALRIEEQSDLYFAHPARSFAETDEALRLRRVGEASAITYKGPKIDATTKTRREIEVRLQDGAAAAAATRELLEAIGFRPVREVVKRREILALAWRGRGVEAAIDDVQGLGAFLELEVPAEQVEVPAARGELQELARKLGVEGSERRSYLEMLLEQDGGAGRAAGKSAG